MKNIKILPISIATIILLAFIAVSFTIFDASQTVAIKGVAGSYAETYAKDNNIEFIAIDDSENPNVEIHSTEKETTTQKAEETTKAETTTKQTLKENSEFAYNYENDTVSITAYKGSSSVVTVPDTIDNLPVKEIKFDVLDKGITTVEIPESVTSIKTDFTSARYTTTFIVAIVILALGYVFAVVSTLIGFKKQQNAEGTFYGIPFVYSGLSTFIVVTVWSGIAIFIGATPILQAIVAVIIFACALGKLLKKSVARELVVERGEQVKKQTQFIKMLTADAGTLQANAKNDEAKALAKKVYEAIRYSDPISTEDLAEIDSQIQSKFAEFENMITKSDVENAKLIADELLTIIEKRNNKCKTLR